MKYIIKFEFILNLNEYISFDTGEQIRLDIGEFLFFHNTVSYVYLIKITLG